MHFNEIKAINAVWRWTLENWCAADNYDSCWQRSTAFTWCPRPRINKMVINKNKDEQGSSINLPMSSSHPQNKLFHFYRNFIRQNSCPQQQESEMCFIAAFIRTVLSDGTTLLISFARQRQVFSPSVLAFWTVFFSRWIICYTSTKHVKYVMEKAQRWLNVLAWLGGTTWGTQDEDLRRLVIQWIWPFILNGDGEWLASSCVSAQAIVDRVNWRVKVYWGK